MRWWSPALLIAALALGPLTACEQAEPSEPAVGGGGGEAPMAEPEPEPTPEPEQTPEPEPEDDPDAPPMPESDFAVELGVGEAEFVPIEHGETALLQRGCQGAQHIWVSVRAPALEPGTHRLVLALDRPDDGVEVVPPYGVEYDWDQSDDGAALYGITLVVFDPLAIVGETGDIHATIEAADGRVGRAILRVHVEWGPDACRPHG